jgi:hypothetical protein
VGRSSTARYATSALRAAQHTFTLVTAEPTNLHLHGEDFGDDLPAGPIALPRLRDLLLAPSTSLVTRDAVWRELIERARADRSTWVVMAVGMAMPGLRRCLRELKLAFRGEATDLESEIAKGFLEALNTIDVTEWALCARLVRAAHKAGVRLVYAEAAFDGARWEEFDSRAPVPPWGHPDFLLLGAVDAGVISDEEAKLIATTRLEDVPVDQIAALLGERTNTVVQRRRRAENRLAEALAEGKVTALETTPSLALLVSRLSDVAPRRVALSWADQFE